MEPQTSYQLRCTYKATGQTYVKQIGCMSKERAGKERDDCARIWNHIEFTLEESTNPLNTHQ